MQNTFVCTWLCFFPRPERSTTYSVHPPACTHACMCVYMYVCISVHVLALEPRGMETEWTWQSRLLGMSQTPTCGPSSGPSQSQSPVAAGVAHAWGPRWHSWFAALSGPLMRWLGLQGCGALPGAQHACFLLHKLLQHLQLPFSQSPTQRGPLINQLSCR